MDARTYTVGYSLTGNAEKLIGVLGDVQTAAERVATAVKTIGESMVPATGRRNAFTRILDQYKQLAKANSKIELPKIDIEGYEGQLTRLVTTVDEHVAKIESAFKRLNGVSQLMPKIDNTPIQQRVEDVKKMESATKRYMRGVISDNKELLNDARKEKALLKDIADARNKMREQGRQIKSLRASDPIGNSKEIARLQATISQQGDIIRYNEEALEKMKYKYGGMTARRARAEMWDEHSGRAMRLWQGDKWRQGMTHLGSVNDELQTAVRFTRQLGQLAQNAISLKVTADTLAATTSFDTLQERITALREFAALPIEVGKAAMAVSTGKKGATPEKPTVAVRPVFTRQETINALKFEKPPTIKVSPIPDVAGLQTKLEEKEYIINVKANLDQSALNGLKTVKQDTPIPLRINAKTDDTAFNLNNSIANLAKLANGKTIPLRVDFNGSDIGFKLNRSITRLQELAKTKVIWLRVDFNGSDIGFKLNQSITRLQELIKGKPIWLRLDFNGGDTAFKLNQSITRLQQLAKSKVIWLSSQVDAGTAAFNLNQSISNLQNAVKSKPIILASKIDTVDLDKQIKAFKPKNTITVHAKLGWGTGQQSRASQLKALQSGLQPIPMEVNLSIDAAKAKLQELKAYASSLNPLNMTTNLSGANKGRVQDTTKQTIITAAKENAKNPPKSRPTAPGERLTPTSVARAVGNQFGEKNDFYSKLRKGVYPFTGNTSFGARTPMALDMAKGMGMMFAVSGVMRTVTGAFHQVSEYENMMKTVEAILRTNDTGANFGGRFKGMENEIRRVGRETKFTAPEVAGAAKFMAMAGLNMEDINAATNPVANLALVGDNDLTETADKMTNIMTSFGLLKGLSAAEKKRNMIHTSDVLTNTFTKSNTNLLQLAEVMQYAGPMSHLTGTALEDAAAMVGVMGNAGVQASMAGTTLRMMYQNIVKPNKKQAAEWDRLGIKRTDSNGNVRDIFDILTDLHAKITGTTDLNAPIDKEQLKKMGAEVMSLFRTTAGAGTAALLENLGEAKRLAESNRSANGVAQEIADEKKNTIAGLWAQVTSTFTDQSVNTVSEFTETIKQMLKDLRDWLGTQEAADTLRTIYDMAKSVLEVFGSVAKIWKNLFNFAPGLLKSFISMQMWMTQLGFVLGGITQVVGVVSSFGKAILGLASVFGMTTNAANALTAAFVGGAGIKTLSNAGKIVSANTQAIATGNALTAASGYRSYPAIVGANGLASWMAIRGGYGSQGTYYRRNPWFNANGPMFVGNYKAVRPPFPVGGRNLMLESAGVFGLMKNQDFAYTQADRERMALIERSRGYMTRGYTPTQLRQHNLSINKMLADVRAPYIAGSAAAAATSSRMYQNYMIGSSIASLFPGRFGVGAMYANNPVPSASGRFNQMLGYTRRIPGEIMPFHAASGKAGSVIWQTNGLTGEMTRGYAQAKYSGEYLKRAALYNTMATAMIPVLDKDGNPVYIKDKNGKNTGIVQKQFKYSEAQRAIWRDKANQYMYQHNAANVLAQNEAKAAETAAKTARLGELRQLSQARKAGQRRNLALIERAAAMGVPTAQTWLAEVQASRKWRWAPSRLKKAQDRQLSNKALVFRAISMGKLSAGNAMAKSGMIAADAWSSATAYNPFKAMGSMLSSVIVKVAKAFGALLSPLGILTMAIGACGTVVYLLNKRLNEQREQYEKASKRASEHNTASENAAYGGSSHTLTDFAKTFNQRASEKRLIFASPAGKNPLMRNSKEFKYAFLSSVTEGTFNMKGGVYDTLIRPMTQAMYGKNMDVQSALRAEMGGLPGANYMAWRETGLNRMRNRAVITRAASTSNEYRQAMKKVQALRAGYMNLGDKATAEDASKMKQQILDIAEQFSDKGANAKSLIGADLANARYNDVVSSKEAYYYMAKNIREFAGQISEAHNFMLNTVAMMNFQMKNVQGNIVHFTLPTNKKGIDWVALQLKLKTLGVNFQLGVKSQLGFLIQIFDMIQSNVELAKKYANISAQQLLDSIAPITVGSKLNPAEWKDMVTLWYNDNYQGKGGYKDADDFFKRGGWKTIKSLQTIRGYYVDKMTGGATIKDLMSGNGSNTNKNTAGSTPPPSQDGYKSNYQSHARPTQITFTIDNLCRFDNSKFGTITEKDLGETIGRQMAEGLNILFAQAAAQYQMLGEGSGYETANNTID